MKKAQLFTATFVVVIMLCQSTYAQKADERAVVAKGFVLAIADGSLSNEQIMKKFVQTRYYFTPDSTELRAAADKHLNDLRKSAQTTDLSSYIAYPYVGHEDEFAVMASGSLGETATKKRLVFSLDIARGVTVDVNPKDLYVVGEKDEKGKGMILLFDDQNRILRFTSMRFRNYVGYWQW